MAKPALNPAWPTDPEAALLPVAPDGRPGPQYHSHTVKFQGIPGLERTPGGRLYAIWYAGGPGEGPENYTCVVRSDDDGRTWTEPVLVIDPPRPVRAFDPMLWLDPRGRLWVFWAQSFAWHDGRVGVWCITTDEPDAAAPRWSAPRRLAHGIALNKPTITRAGEWLLPVSVWGGKNPCHPVCQAECAANVYASLDQGATWTRRGGALLDGRIFDEHMLVERADGSLWMLIRTLYGIGESTSTDGGRTWSAGRDSKLGGPNSRFFVRRLASGRLLLVNHRVPQPVDPNNQWRTRNNLPAWLSEDDGRTWRGGLLLDERAGVSYPDGVQAPDGRLYVIYDYNRTQDREILMAVFTEDDVLAGAWRSPAARQRVLVSKGRG